jgi:hypothetical protein
MTGASLGLALRLLLQAEEPSVEVEETLQRAPRVRFELGARIELRSGQPDSSVRNSNLTETEVDPVVSVQVPFRGATLTLAYEPRLFLLVHEVPQQEAQKAHYLNRARLVLDATPSPRWRIYLNGRFAYGVNDFLPLSVVPAPTGNTNQPPVAPGTTPTAPTPNPGTGRLPDSRFLRVIDVDVSSGLVHGLSPRLQWLLSAGYVYSGGATVEERSALPLQQGPKGSTGLQWSASPKDWVAYVLEVDNSRFSSGPQSTIANLTASWTRAWSRTLGTDLTGGAGGFHAIIPPQGQTPGKVQNSVLPVGGLGLRYSPIARGFSWRNSLTFLAAPAPDRISGVIYERLSTTLRSAWAPSERLLFEIAGGGGVTVGVPQRDTRVEGRVGYQFATEFGVFLGGRAAWVEGSNLLGSNGFGWLAFVAVSTSVGASLSGMQQ